MTIRTIKLAVGLLLAFPAARAALAQVDHRVDHRVPGTDGRLLDKNPQVGSGGVNPAGSYGFDAGRQSNASVTGNLTGLANFHGGTQVLQTNQFRSSLPSAGLSGFVGTSVGLEQSSSHQALRPTYFFAREQTVADLGYIRSGLNLPASSTLRSTLTGPPLTQTLNADRSVVMPDPADTRLYVNPPKLRAPGTRQLGLFPSDESSTTDPRTPFSYAADSSIFGTPRPFLSPRLDSPIRGLTAFDDDRSTDSMDASTRPTPRVSRDPTLYKPLDEIIKPMPRVTGIAPESESETEPSPALAGPRSNVRPLMQDDQSGESLGTTSDQLSALTASPFASEGIRPWNPGQDRFTDLQNAVRAAQQSGQRRLGFANRAGLEAIDAFGAMPERGSESKEAESPSREVGKEVADLSTAMRWTKDLLEDPITSFAGRYDDRLNQYISSAEEALHQGEYYRASSLFKLAHSVDSRNPLPLLGRGHALIAAGDYLSAAFMLEQGISRFPQIAAFRLDLPTLVGQHDIFDIRRADLEKRLAAAEHYELRFLLGYLELYSGLQTDGLRNLELAAKHAPKDSVISIFPDLVLGRRELPSLDESRR